MGLRNNLLGGASTTADLEALMTRYSDDCARQQERESIRIQHSGVWHRHTFDRPRFFVSAEQVYHLQTGGKLKGPSTYTCEIFVDGDVRNHLKLSVVAVGICQGECLDSKISALVEEKLTRIHIRFHAPGWLVMQRYREDFIEMGGFQLPTAIGWAVTPEDSMGALVPSDLFLESQALLRTSAHNFNTEL